MYRIVIVILIYRSHRPTDFKKLRRIVYEIMTTSGINNSSYWYRKNVLRRNILQKNSSTLFYFQFYALRERGKFLGI
jgi:hypothetical protein